MATDIVETRHDRRLLAADAGLGRVSLLSVLAGVMTAYGTFVLVLAVTAGVLRLLGVDTRYSASDWKDIGLVGGVVTAAVLSVSYLFGGYVAGRMARRAGVTNGLLVLVLGLLFLVGAAALANAATDTSEILRNLRSLGIPTTASEWADAGLIVGSASLAAMLIGSLLGGALGERWHGKLLSRAVDPGYGLERERPVQRDDWRTTVERPASTSVRTLGADDRDRDRTAVD